MSRFQAIDHRSNLEKATQWHVAVLVISAAWMFGGRIDWARIPLICLGVIGVGLTILGLIDRRQRGAPVGRWLMCLLPPTLLALFSLLSSFNPSMEKIRFDEVMVYRPSETIPWLPSSVDPALTRSELALLFGIFLSAFNLALNIHQRRTLRQLTLILGLNACVLALFGTIQKIAGADMFLGLIESPNPTFFASFIYHNHWGPFVLVNIAGWFGLVEFLARRDRGRGFLHSPAMSALIAILLLAVTLPLSTSRSSTVMLSVLLPVCGFWLLWRMGRRSSRPIARSTLGLIGITAVAFAGVSAYWLGGDTIKSRIGDTKDQIGDMREAGSLGQRARVYEDTWRFFQMRPVAGWGLESYAFVYRRYNDEPRTADGFIIQFDEAHSDWLQLLAEVGVVGISLFLLSIGIPLWPVRHRLWREPYSGCVFLCLGLLMLYAWVEFPFANPAVTASAATAFFGAIRHLQLSR